MAILGKHSVEDFLSEYWQKKPLLIRGASQDFSDVLTADELAGMACEEQVESRLILKEQGDWALENGPLPEQRFSELPEHNWTLLVQSVDQWLPEVRDVLDEFDFLPDWRLDDVMISYATEGGGVGPHFDYYDVFLLQTNGKRRWKLGQKCDQNTVLREGQPLKLLKRFEQAEEFDLEAGDMLYIPAGIAHWGTGLDDECMTWSVGFRAPSAKELLTGAIELVANELPDDLRYTDTAQSLSESLKGDRSELNPDVAVQVAMLRESLSDDVLQEAMTDILGTMATEPRYSELLEVEPWADEELEQMFAQNGLLKRNPASRLAYRQVANDANTCKLYVNGEVWVVPVELAIAVCSKELDLNLFKPGDARDLLVKLLNAGVYLLEG